MTFRALFLLILCCTSSYANDDQDFFEDLDRKILLSANKDHDRAFRFFIKELSQWLMNKEHLSPEQEEALKNAVLTMKNREAFSNQVQLQQVIWNLEQEEFPTVKMLNLHRILNKFQIHTLENTLYSGLPKNFSESILPYLPISEHIRTQTLSKASGWESASVIKTQFPQASFGPSPALPTLLKSIPGYPTILQYKEATFPLQAVRLLIQSTLFEHGFLRIKERARIRSELSKMESALPPGSKSYHFLKSLNHSLISSNTPFEDPEVVASSFPFSSYGGPQNPYSLEFDALMSAYKKKRAEHPFTIEALPEQLEIPGLNVPTKGGLPFPPTTAELVSYQKLNRDFEEFEKAALAIPPTDQLAHLISAQELLDLIAGNPWAKLKDKHRASSNAFDLKDYAKAFHWQELAAQEEEATANDRREAAILAFYANDFSKAAYWYNTIAGTTEGNLDDIRYAGHSAYKMRDFPQAFYWYELVAKKDQATRIDRIHAASVACLLGHHSKHLYWNDRAANTPESSTNEADTTRLAQSEVSSQVPVQETTIRVLDPSALERYERAANGPEGSLEDKRSVATFYSEKRDYSKAVLWWELVIENPDWTLEDSQKLAHAAYRLKDYPKAFYWFEIASNQPNASIVEKRNSAQAALGAEWYTKAFSAFEAIAHSHEATWDDKRYAAYSALQAKNYPRSIFWYDLLVKNRQATCHDLRQLAEASAQMGDYYKASHWYEYIVNNLVGSLQDKLGAGYAAYKIKLYERALRWYEPLFESDLTIPSEHLRAAAYCAYELKQASKALKWFTRLANRSDATPEDKGMRFRSQELGDGRD